ncbi:MAG: Maf family protein [Candidatus Phlomobacter fragariae]
MKQASGKKLPFISDYAYFIVKPGNTILICELFTVYFRHLTDIEIESYLTKEQPYQCARGFMSEGLGIKLFEKLVGRDPNTLIWLLLISLINMLRSSSQVAISLHTKNKLIYNSTWFANLIGYNIIAYVILPNSF